MAVIDSQVHVYEANTPKRPWHTVPNWPMREAVGGGEALIPSNVKVATAGASIDVPLGHKDNARSFDHFDTQGRAVV